MKLQFSDIRRDMAQDSDCWERGNEGAIWLPQPTAWRGFQATVQVEEPCGVWVVSLSWGGVKTPGNPRWIEFTRWITREEKAAERERTLQICKGVPRIFSWVWISRCVRPGKGLKKMTLRDDTGQSSKILKFLVHWREYLQKYYLISELTKHCSEST